LQFGSHYGIRHAVNVGLRRQVFGALRPPFARRALGRVRVAEMIVRGIVRQFHSL
jgi:hypothetical protein